MPDPLGGFAFTWPFYAAALIGYLIGSIPFGLILSKLGGEGDIRAIGSGNIGATNVLRTGRKGLALATLLLDGGKGALVVVIADAYLTQDFAVLAGGGAVLGHMFPLWLGFGGRAAAAQTVVTIIGVVAAYLLVSAGGSVSAALAGVALLAAAAWFAWGGKGVATGLGLLLAIAWPVGVVACLTWLITAAVFRFSSLAALWAFVLAPIAMWYLSDPTHSVLNFYQTDLQRVEFAVFLAFVTIIRHRENIVRIARGKETRIGRSADQRSDDAEK